MSLLKVVHSCVSNINQIKYFNDQVIKIIQQENIKYVRHIRFT